MKLGFYALALTLGFGLAVPTLAQEQKEEPAKTEPAKEEPTKEEPAKPPAEAPPPAKELSACAKSFVPLSDSYKNAYDAMQKWIAQIDSQTTAASEKVTKLEAQIQQNGTDLTQAKLNNDTSKTKDLEKQSKQLWDDLNTAKKDLAGACSKFAKEASDRVKQYADATSKALDTLKSQNK